MLPLLVVLFMVSYGLLTMLVVEQGRTIDSQRSLIHLLFGDSVQLGTTRMAAHKNRAEQKSNPQQDSTSTQAQTPSSQVSPGQSPSAQVPQNPSKPQANVRPGRGSRKAQKAVPPPAEMTDPSDMRRVSFSI
jgi:hypothetical protein